MGTKVEYSVNLLATSLDSNKLRVGGVDVWEHYQNKVLTNYNLLIKTRISSKVQDPIMDRMLERNNIEYIKRTMQMHEAIFKQQVRELHRLYSVQKMLMDELRKEIRQQKLLTPLLNGIDERHPHFIEQQQHLVAQASYGLDFHVHQNLMREEAAGSSRGFDLERPACEEEVFMGGEAGPSNHGGCDNEEMEVDLTLSIGGSSSSSSHVKKHDHVAHLACSQDSSPNGKSRIVGECNDPTTPLSSTTVTFTQTQGRNKGPHWLSQGLN
ncbi:hypothetical protein HN51_002134 [Arachis hypogaea]|uniref:Uncharacterized protein n=2 Tax=Arachis TaxID=3817 RepID=A0A445ENL6_ARAHY|nr:uncharacterized protein LOC107460271 [Arachis duranensis]XP_025607007.1 uncharacterized protein LOC112697857 [Arachis hypogaea]XP_025607015.1 uncharacterized protein LOC112697857 [Arachis hypogaea]XP_057744867.1 uncharacterized protein LOC130962706 [Arachis stenosperma]QHO50298.1 uncharacterized protein DS421_1g21370 [Arachis hypogaea]RYR77064.1 hypothetical protein Ahy_A01g001542 [Arachis hypogaea]